MPPFPYCCHFNLSTDAAYIRKRSNKRKREREVPSENNREIDGMKIFSKKNFFFTNAVDDRHVALYVLSDV